jgi:hypothetical protein
MPSKTKERRKPGHSVNSVKKIKTGIDKYAFVCLNLSTSLKMSDKRYTAGDVGKIVKMNRHMLHYCVKTLGLIKPAQIRPRVTLYDFNNLLDLMLVQILHALGIAQGFIRMIIIGAATIDTPPRYITVWDDFRYCQARGSLEKEGLILAIKLTNDGGLLWMTQPREDLRILFPSKARGYAKEKRASHFYPGGGTVIVDIRDLVHYIENETGETLR